MFLPGPLAWIKKTLAILKSNLTPNQIAFGFALGILAGLPPTGLHIILPFTVAVFVRCSYRAFLVSFGLFKLLSLASAPGAYAVGRWLLDASRGLDSLWRSLFHLPVFAPMGYGRYLLLGSLALGLLIAIPAFVLVRFLVSRYRASFAAWVSGWRMSSRLKGRRSARLFRWALAGGEAKYETGRSPRGVLRFVRREGLIALPAAYVVCYLLAAFLVPIFAGTLATSTASWIVGSEVAVTDSTFNLFSGRLRLTELSVQDPKSPTENLLEIPAITLDAGMAPLIAKRVVFDDVIIADAKLHVVREEDGTLNVDNVSSGWNADGYAEWAVAHAKDVDWLGLLRQLLRYLSDLRPLGPREDSLEQFRGGRSFPDFRPPFAVRRIEVGRVLVSLEDRHRAEGALPGIALLEIEVSNLAFPTSLRDEPISIRLRGQFEDDPESGFEFAARFDGGEIASSAFSASLSRIDLPRIAAFYRTTLPVEVVSAKATAKIDVQFVGGEASGSVSLLVEDLELRARDDRPLFGLPAATSENVIAGLNRYAEELPIVVGFPIGGTAEAPTWEWEVALLDVARNGLLMVGERRLQAAIEDLGLRIDALGGVATSPLDSDYGALRTQADEAAREIIGASAGGVLDTLLDRPLGSSNAEETSEETPSSGIAELVQRLLEGQAEDGD